MAYTTRSRASESLESASQQKTAAQIADNRASTAAQLVQQSVMGASPQVAAQRHTADVMAASPVQQLKTIQRAGAEEELQMKAKEPAQRAGVEEELPAQGKFAAQLAGVEEELPMQGKFAAQLTGVEEEPLQGKFTTAQLAGVEEEPMQGKFKTAQLAGVEEELPMQGKFAAPVQREEAAPAPNRTGMPDNLKSGIENLSGHSMDDVKVHYNSSKPAELQAHAYAQGSDIHVAPGQEQHLPHEAWHVVQQKQGRVQPTMQAKGVPVNDDVGLESEADTMGAKALQMAQLKKED